jgi:competence ComEA-like helix-hairpin-helix protein
MRAAMAAKSEREGIMSIITYGKFRISSAYVIIFFVLAIIGLAPESVQCQGWSDLDIRTLPDSSFAVIEVDEYGTKIRHCPHHDLNGKLDEEQLIYVLGTFHNEEWVDPQNKKVARKHLEKHYDKFMAKIRKKELQEPLDINKATLTELVMLPNIGPVLAVKIVEYRNNQVQFELIEDIKKVEGIGQGTFNAIRHYICAY